MRYLWIVCIVILLTRLVSPASADQNDPRLNDLFNQLREVSEPADLSATEGQIWTIWHETTDQQVGSLLQSGINAMQSGDHRSALVVFDQVVTLAPGFAEGWNKRATVHYLLGNFDQSLDDIAVTLALEPRHFGALSGKGMIYVGRDDLENALAAFESVLAISPNMVAPRINAEAIRRILKGREI